MAQCNGDATPPEWRIRYLVRRSLSACGTSVPDGPGIDGFNRVSMSPSSQIEARAPQLGASDAPLCRKGVGHCADFTSVARGTPLAVVSVSLS